MKLVCISKILREIIESLTCITYYDGHKAVNLLNCLDSANTVLTYSLPI